MDMRPPRRIRVALVGLSSTAATAWAARAHLPYLLSPRGRAKYEVMALLNSSEPAARAAMASYGLLPAGADDVTVRAYGGGDGGPAALAADGDVDLVVVNTRVDAHFASAWDSVLAGKDLFVEWPLAHDAAHARRLAEGVRKAAGARSVVGLQGLRAPVAGKVREVLEAGRIGRVVSSEVRVFGGLEDRLVVPEKLGYFMERETGGNVYTIGFAHLFDMVQAVLGELASAKGDFHLQRPDVPVQDSNNAVKTVRSNVPDLFLISGRWDESNITQKDATLHYRFRRGQPFPGDPALVWTINGEKGEIRVISPETSFITVGDPKMPRFIEVHDFETNKVDKVEWDWEDWQKELPIPARNIGALYESFADVKPNGGEEKYRTFDDAVKRHEQLEKLLADWQP